MKKIVALLLAAMLLITAFAGCSGEQSKTETQSPVALKAGGLEFTVEDMNYMYMTTFNDVYNTFYGYYGDYMSNILDITKPLEEQMIEGELSWHQYILDVTVDSTKTIVGVYNAAIENGFVLPEDYQNDIDTFDEQLAAIAEEYGMSVDEYIYYSYGENASIESVKKMTEIQIYCNAYVEEYSANIEVSDEDIETYYSANKNAIDTVDFHFYTTYYGTEEGDLTQEEAEAQANTLAKATTVEEFIALAKDFTTDEENKKQFDEGDPTLYAGSSYDSTGIEEVAEWLFDESRVTGDTMVYHDESYTGYIAIMFETRVDPDYDYINVRHILIAPEADAEGKVSDEAWSNAEVKANEIYNGYLAGEMTEEAFGELAKEHSADGSAANGGLYENVVKGQMVEAFNNWCFDEARTAGDTGIVKTPYGYHIMYFAGFGENNLIATVEPLIAEERLSAFISECEINCPAEPTDEMNNVGGMIDDIINSANEAAGTETSETEKETKSFTGIIIGVLVAIILVCIVIIIKNGGKKKAEPEVTEETEEAEEPVLEATDEDLTEEELAAEEAFEETASEEVSEETAEETTEE